MRAIHLKRRGTIYHWRRRVPLSLVHVLGRDEVAVSLHTGSARAAALRARQLTARTDRLFEMLLTVTDTDDIADVARAFLEDILNEAEGGYTRTSPVPIEAIETKRARALKLEQDARQALITNDLRQADGLLARLAERQRVTVEPGTPEHDLLRRHLLRAVVEGAVAVRARHSEGRYDHQPLDPLFQAGQGAPIASRRLRGGPKLSEVITKYLADKERKNTRQTVAQDTRTLDFLLGWLGECSFASIDRRNLSDFFSAVAGLPRDHGQDPSCRKKSLRQILDIKKVDAPVISQKTFNRHAAAVSGLFTWAKKNGYWEGENPATGFIDKKAVPPNKTRRPWRKEELEQLLRSPPWSGCKSAKQHLVRGDVIVRDLRFFIPFLGLFAGLRLEEACALYAEDVRCTDGIWVLDIVGDEDGRTKEDPSNRTIPLHPQLIKLGLLDHAQHIKAKGGGHLWPEATRGGLDQRYSHNVSKWFTRARRKAGLDDRKTVNHSFRHNLGSALRGAGINESIVADILGHAHRTMSFRVYSEGAAVRPLYDAICKVDYGIDLTHLYLKRDNE